MTISEISELLAQGDLPEEIRADLEQELVIASGARPGQYGWTGCSCAGPYCGAKCDGHFVEA